MQTNIDSFERLTIPQPWSDDEIKRLFHLRNVVGWDWSEIALDLGRTESGVKSKYKYATYQRETKVPSIPFIREPTPEDVLIDRAKRFSEQHQSLTAAICGDPVFSQSALAKRIA